VALLFVDVLVVLEVEVGFVEDEEGLTELEELLEPQVPPTGLHPVPQ
jgi:hypothetical protein